MAVKTQGSQLYIVDTTGSDPCQLLAIDCVTSLTGLNAPREQMETTCMEDDVRAYEAGLSTPGQITVSVNFDPANESHMRLYELWANDSGNFKAAIGLGGPRGSDPILGSGCELEFPENRSFVEFEGYVVDLPLEGALNSVWTAAIPIQVSGKYIIHRRTV